MKAIETNGIMAITHDWDDTAVITHESIFKLYQDFATLYKLKSPELAHVRKLWGNSVKNILAGLWPDENSFTLLQDFEAAVPSDHAVEPFPWLKETICKLAAHYALGVVSSTPRRGVDRTCAKYGLDLSIYTHFQTGDDSALHKPDPRVFDGVMAKLVDQGIPEGDVIYVGDSLGDFQAASARGIMFVAVTTGFTTAEEFVLAGLKGELVLENFGQLPKWLGI